MNAYFDKNQASNSNSRIFNAYYGSQSKRESRLGARVAKLRAILGALVSARTLRVARAVTFSTVLVAFVGIVGAMEHGTLGLGAGLVISAFLLAVELLCLYPHRA